MPCEVNRTVNFGTTKTGLRHVGYCLINTKGAIIHSRSELGVHEVGEGTGIYSAMVCFPDQFRGTVLWDTGETRPSYAAEEYNYYDNNNVMLEQMKYVFDQLSFIRGLQAGRWALKKETAEMIFYDETGENMLVSYTMTDSKGNPSLEEVFDRVVNEINAPEYPPIIADPPPDVPPSYALLPGAASVDEGSAVNFTVSTSRLVKTLYWSLEPSTSTAASGDFRSTPSSLTYGTVSIAEGSGAFALEIENDLRTEGDETFTVSLRQGGPDGDIVATSTITVKDTSTTPPPPPPPPPPVVTRNQVIYIAAPSEEDEQPDPLGPLPAFLNAVNIVQVAMGYEFALALDDTGRVYAWGNESFYGITNVPQEAQTGVKKITAGTNFAYVLKNDGTVVGWGDPAGNRFDYTGLTGITDIASAWNDTLFIDSNRKAHHRGERTYDLTDWAYGIDGIAVGRFNIAANQFGWAKVKGMPNNGALNIDPALEAGIEWIHAVGGTSFFARAANGTIVGWGNDSARLLAGVLDFLEDYPDVTSTYQALGTEAGLVKLHDPNRRLGRFFDTSVYATGMIDTAGRINAWGLFAPSLETPIMGAVAAAMYDRSILAVIKGS